MPLIEGLGDEVTLVLATLLVCMVVTFAWFSTHTADLPALREVGITVIERTQIRRRVVAQPGGNNDRPIDNQNLAGLIEFVSRSSASASEEVEETSSSSRSSQEREVSSPVEGETENVTLTAAGSVTTPDTTTSATAQPLTAATTATSVSDHSSQETLLCRDNSGQQQSEAKFSEGHFEDQEQLKESVVSAGEGNDLQNASEPVSSSQASELPVEEEVRRRRVEFFQSAPSSSLQSTCDNVLGASKVDSTAENASPGNQSLRSSVSGAHVDNTDSVPASSQPTQPSPDSNSSDRQEATHDSDNIRVRLKYMNETQRFVYTSPLDTIGNFRRTHFQQELQEGDKWVRFIFNGQDLRDDEATLQAYQVGDNCTMHCLITNKRRAPSTQAGSGGSGGGLHGGDDEDNDSVMGTLMYPLFTLVLAVVWYFRLTYRQYFSPMSTVCLIGISFLLGLGYFSSLRNGAAATANQQGQPSSGTGDQPETRQNR